LPRISCGQALQARIGDENLRAGNSRVGQRPVENATGGADERLARKIFFVAGLLADQHHVGRSAPLARHCLGCVLVERAARAFVLGLGKLGKRVDRGGKLEIELRLLWHRALLSRHTGNAQARRQFVAGADGSNQRT
jgi:hypothetical protein